MEVITEFLKGYNNKLRDGLWHWIIAPIDLTHLLWRDEVANLCPEQ